MAEEQVGAEPDASGSGDADGRRGGSRNLERGWRAFRWANGAVGFAALVLVAALVSRPGPLSFDPATDGPELVAILVGSVVLVLSLTVAVLRPERGTTRRLAWTAALGSAVLLVALAAVWYLIDADVRDEPEIGTPLLNDADVEAFLGDDRTAPDGTAPPPFRVPTGVLVQSVEFLNANDVELSGFVWQMYADGIPDDVTRGFVLPEAVDAAYQADEAFRIEENGVQVIGWHVHVTLRQPFDYGRYPFDRQDVWLRLWHRDLDRGVVLVPDFASYADTAPASLPGIEEQFVYGGWEPEFSGFSYARNPDTPNFGFAGDRGGPAVELYFNLGLKRAFIGPFLDHIVLAAAVSLLLFVVVGLTTNDEDLQKRFGFNTAGVVGSASGLLFAVILKHNQIRTIVANREVAYLEVLPFLLYGAILLVALNAIVLASPVNVRLVEYRKNLLPVLAYWPLLLGLLLLVTLLVFFG